MSIIGNHLCAFGSDSELINEPDASWRTRVCKKLRNAILISEHHPLSLEVLPSFPALVAERQRHLMENKNVIHPLSIFWYNNSTNVQLCYSLVWNSFMIINNLALIVFASLHLFIVIEPSTFLFLDCVIVVPQAFCLLDMIIRFNTGHLHKESATIELNRRRIAWAYLRSYWLPDLLSCVPVSFMMHLASNRSRHDYLIPDILPLARAIRIITVLDDLHTLLKTLTTDVIWYRMVRHILLFLLAIHFFTCLLFVPSVITHYVHGGVPVTYTGFLDTRNVSRAFYDLPVSQRYVKGMFVAVSAFFNTGFNMFKTFEKGEIIVNSSILLFGSMFKMYTIAGKSHCPLLTKIGSCIIVAVLNMAVFALKTYMTLYNSTLRYHELMDQVEKYMRHQQFPASLSRRLRDFYSYHFQGHYYREAVALGCLSAHLRNEIQIHTLQTWIHKVPVLRDLSSSVLGRFMGCLESKVYMPNDLIFHVGDVGYHMYFIATGTTTLYSMRGVEMCHFEDGDFFGALALVTTGARRMTTIVAVEITHVYQLSFDNLRELGPELHDRIKDRTIERFTKIMNLKDLELLDENIKYA